MMEDKISVLISEKELNERIEQLGKEIEKDYEGKNPHLICILKGGVFMTCELAKSISLPLFFGLYVCIQLWQRDCFFR